MATTLNRNLRRRLRYTSATKNGRICRPEEAGARPVNLEIGTDEVIRFRIHGTRRIAEIHCVVAFQVAQVLQLETDYRDRMADYLMKKKAGFRRLRKPKKPFVPSILK